MLKIELKNCDKYQGGRRTVVIITKDEWLYLNENFETTDLLDSLYAIDKLRDHLNDREYGTPPKIRCDLLKLHQLSIDVVNNGRISEVDDFFDLADDLDDQIEQLLKALEQVQATLSRLMALYPESLCYDDNFES